MTDRIYHVPPELAGSIVEYAYAYDDGVVYRRITDYSDGVVLLALAFVADADPETPWNGSPAQYYTALDWRPVH